MPFVTFDKFSANYFWSTFVSDINENRVGSLQTNNIPINIFLQDQYALVLFQGEATAAKKWSKENFIKVITEAEELPNEFYAHIPKLIQQADRYQLPEIKNALLSIPAYKWLPGVQAIYIKDDLTAFQQLTSENPILEESYFIKPDEAIAHTIQLSADNKILGHVCQLLRDNQLEFDTVKAIKNATLSNKASALDCLLTHTGNIDVNTIMVSYAVPLLIGAIKFANSDKDISAIIAVLIKHGAKVNISTNLGQTVLHTALKNIHTHSAVSMLLAQKGILVNHQDNHGNTPLHIAVKNHASIATITLLLQAGASLDVSNKDKATPLSLAQDETTVKLFHAHLAEKKRQVREALLKPLQDENAALHKALAAARKENVVLKELLKSSGTTGPLLFNRQLSQQPTKSSEQQTIKTSTRLRANSC